MAPSVSSSASCDSRSTGGCLFHAYAVHERVSPLADTIDPGYEQLDPAHGGGSR